jgi:hypothetical protein
VKAPSPLTTWALALVLLATVPLLYAASIGPACRWASARTVNTIYWPLIAGCDESPLERPLCQWIEWWHPAGPNAWTIFHNGEVAWQLSQRD